MVFDHEFAPGPMDTSHIKRKWLDIPYASKSQTQKLDIYLPDTGDGPFPIIATFHGGAWMFGDKGDEMNLHFLEGLKHGYAVACVNYRLSGEAHFPTQIHDCKTAIRYLRTNAADYCLDGTRIGAWGASAGGHLAALLGVAARTRELDNPSMRKTNTRFSCKVHAVVVWYGPIEDFIKMDEQLTASGMGTPDHSGAGSPESKLLGRRITDVPALVKFASPMTYIKPSAPPFLIQHGLNDGIVPVEQSIHFAAQMEKIAGADRVTLDLLKGADHGDPLFEKQHNLRRVFDFFDLHLK
ncbi:Carboxylesterase NlhH [Anaerolineales bacterium]|nr:Carboxylesterase NlhH [Anaerolineales bacterium]